MLLVVLLLLRRLLLTVIPMLLSSMVLHMLLLWLLMLVIRGVLLLAAASVLLWEVSVRRLELLLLVLGDCGLDGRGRCLLRLMVLLLVCRRVEQVAGRWLLLARRGITATSARLLLPDNVDISAIIVVVIRLLMLLRLLIDCSTTILRKVLLELLLLLCCRCLLRLLSPHCHASTTAVVTILQLLRRLPLSSIDSTILLLSAGCHYLHPAPLAAILLLICRVSALILVLTGAGRTHLNVLIGSLTLIQKVRWPGRRRIEHLLLLLHHASVRRRGPGLVRR